MLLEEALVEMRALAVDIKVIFFSLRQAYYILLLSYDIAGVLLQTKNANI